MIRLTIQKLIFHRWCTIRDHTSNNMNYKLNFKLTVNNIQNNKYESSRHWRICHFECLLNNAFRPGTSDKSEVKPKVDWMTAQRGIVSKYCLVKIFHYYCRHFAVAMKLMQILSKKLYRNFFGIIYLYPCAYSLYTVIA